MGDRKATSIKINQELWKEFKKRCIDLDKDLSDRMEELIKADCKEES